ncbi:hypothetical protein JMJ35_003665 [Cladonia borealis]|uniref:Rhodopsin domain-containing protein n=1 Tax=Cladonia borealis TaxID=184061 RepID=A0AA39V2W9_9LECA|nr:hypothetical protein JMJ35_003665 [Cladonia borealis]
MNDTLAQDIAVLVGLTGMSLVFVVLRMLARLMRKVSLGLDDYWILACAVLNLPYFGVVLWGLLDGEQGQHNTDLLPLSRLRIYLKSVYIAAILYSVIITFAKYSVLCLYRRIFGTALRQSTLVLFVLQSIWMIVCVFEGLLRCQPVAAAWNVVLPAKCQNFTLIVVAAEPFNALLDFVMVAMPVNIVRKLQLPTRHKITLSGIFVLGSFVGIMCIIRVIETQRGSADTGGKWVIAQMNTGIVCACLPTLRPILPKRSTIATTFRDLITSFRTTNRSSGSEGPGSPGATVGPVVNSRRNRYKNLTDDMVDYAHLTEAVGGDEPLDPKKDIPLNRIAIQQDVDVV